jgi:succinate dehydrogenase/fumarate reductase-like Fe-S protein
MSRCVEYAYSACVDVWLASECACVGVREDAGGNVGSDAYRWIVKQGNHEQNEEGKTREDPPRIRVCRNMTPCTRPYTMKKRAFILSFDT